jgi:Tfp pilus assembly protein PilF
MGLRSSAGSVSCGAGRLKMETEKSRLEQFKEFVELDPSDTFSRYALGMEYMGISEFDQAIAQFQEVMRIEPGNSAAYFQSATACERLNDNERAKQFLRQGIQVATERGDKHAKDEMTAALEKLEADL